MEINQVEAPEGQIMNLQSFQAIAATDSWEISLWELAAYSTVSTKFSTRKLHVHLMTPVQEEELFLQMHLAAWWAHSHSRSSGYRFRYSTIWDGKSFNFQGENRP